MLLHLSDDWYKNEVPVLVNNLSFASFWLTISPCLLYLVRGWSQMPGVSEAGVGGVRAWWVGRSCFKSPRFGLRLCQASPASASVVISSSLY